MDRFQPAPFRSFHTLHAHRSTAKRLKALDSDWTYLALEKPVLEDISRRFPGNFHQRYIHDESLFAASSEEVMLVS